MMAYDLNVKIYYLFSRKQKTPSSILAGKIQWPAQPLYMPIHQLSDKCYWNNKTRDRLNLFHPRDPPPPTTTDHSTTSNPWYATRTFSYITSVHEFKRKHSASLNKSKTTTVICCSLKNLSRPT